MDYSKLDRIINEWQDERILELQQRIKTQLPYQPQPGDADYQTPQQIAQLREDVPDGPVCSMCRLPGRHRHVCE